jgi:hypothetical protein
VEYLEQQVQLIQVEVVVVERQEEQVEDQV